MKKIFIAVLAVAGLAACSQDQLVEAPKGAAIAFDNAFVENSTRANDLTAANISDFGVYGFLSNAAGNGQIFDNQAVTKSGDAFTYSPAQYWVANADYYFAAIAPYANANWTYTAAKETPDAGILSFNNQAAAANQDLLFAYDKRDAMAEITAAPAPVALNFDHMLSRVKFSFVNGFAAGQNITLEVTNVNVANAIAEGTIALEAGVVADEWVVAATPATFNIPFGNAGATLAAAAKGTTEHFYLIPAEATYDVTFDVTLYQAGVQLDKYNRSAAITVDLNRGKSYEFTATLNASNISDDGENALYPIEFVVNPVSEWVEDTADVKDAELRAAAQFGGEVTLAEDIEILSPIVVSNDLIVNLNGKTISSKSDVFEVAAGTLTINGNGVVSAATDNGEPYCAVWAYGDAVVNINGGEYRIGHPAGDYNDLIYAKDNAVINIYGGKFYNSGKENAFVLNLKDNSAATINVYGGEFEKFNPANNLSEGPNTNFVADGYVSEANGDWYVVSQNVIDTVEELKSALTADEKLIEVVLNSDLTYDVAAWQNDAMGGASTEVITIDLNGYTLTFNQTNSDWNNITSASGAKLVIKNGKITNSGYNDGPWNRHDLNFACPVELIDVVSDKAIALKSSATLTRVTINDANTSDTYAIWVQPKGQTVVLDGCTIDMLACTDGRGLKIDNQYLSAAEEALVTLKVSNTVFKTEEKSAILVKSTKGANITLDNVDITEVAADNVNPVWVDEATAAYFDLVTVVGGTKVQE